MPLEYVIVLYASDDTACPQCGERSESRKMPTCESGLFYCLACYVLWRVLRG